MPGKTGSMRNCFRHRQTRGALSSPTSFEEKRSLISTFATSSPVRRRSIAIDQCVRTFVRSFAKETDVQCAQKERGPWEKGGRPTELSSPLLKCSHGADGANPSSSNNPCKFKQFWQPRSSFAWGLLLSNFKIEFLLPKSIFI